MKKLKKVRKAAAFYFRRYEKAILLLALCFSAIVPLVKYSISTNHRGGSHETAKEVELQPREEGGGHDQTGDSGLAPRQGDASKLETPIVCTYGEHELSKWQACNKKKFKDIPSCKRGVNKCVLLPLHKQKLTPFCSDCLEPWKKMGDCFHEAEIYFYTARRCSKAWLSVKNRVCERPSAVVEDGFSNRRTKPFRITRNCILAEAKVAKASAEVAKIKQIVPNAYETIQKQEKQIRQQLRRHGGKRGRRHRNSENAKIWDKMDAPPEAEEEKKEKEEEEGGSNIDYGHVEISSKPQYPTLEIS